MREYSINHTMEKLMKLFKALSQSIINLLAVVDNTTEGANQLSIMFKEVCVSARKEQSIESLNDLKALATKHGLTEIEYANI
jgi:hypothetical protein